MMSFEVSKPRRRYLYVACVGIAAVSIISILATAVRTMGQSALYPLVDDKRETVFQVSSQTCPQTTQTIIQTPKYLDPLNYLNGPPTDRFRGSLCFSMQSVLTEDIHLQDNLRLDMKYITSWISAGWSAYKSTITFCIPQLMPLPSKRCHNICKGIRSLCQFS